MDLSELEFRQDSFDIFEAFFFFFCVFKTIKINNHVFLYIGPLNIFISFEYFIFEQILVA